MQCMIEPAKEVARILQREQWLNFNGSWSLSENSERYFAGRLRWIGRYSSLRGCAGLAALATTKNPRRRTL